LETAADAEQAGMPLAIYHEYEAEKVILEAAIPYSGKLESAGRVNVKATPSGKVIKGVYLGDYEGSESMHYAIADYVEQSKMEIIGSPWEIYANDPEEVEVTEIETHIYYPVK
jgi:effector-binding domain-containing protein